MNKDSKVEAGAGSSPSRRTVLAAAAFLAPTALAHGQAFAQTGQAGPAAPDAAKQSAKAALPTSIAQAARRMRDGELSAEALTSRCFACIDEIEPRLNAFILQLRDDALRTARERDRELASGRDRGPLHGVPVVMKDLYDMEGVVTTVGSRAFRNRAAAAHDATVVRKLREAGAVILGKTNMNEFAAGVSGTNAEFGDTHNPWALERSPGGSSSGSGAMLAAGVAFGGTATDTGGSIRVPASWCGITGIRPTTGLVSLAGVFPRSLSLDVAGPLARNVPDLSLMLDAMVGYDPADPHSALAQPAKSYAESLEGGVRGLRFGIVANYTFRDVEPDVADAVRAAADTLQEMGAHVEEIAIPPLEGRLDYGALFNEVLLYEFNQILGEQYRSTPDAESLYGPIVTANIAAGSKVEKATYDRRIAERPGVIAELKQAFGKVDALLTPALPTTAPLLKASSKDFGRGRQFTIPFSYTALPSIVVPCGFDHAGLPIGLQIVGDHYREALLFQIAAAFERETDFGERRPPVHCE